MMPTAFSLFVGGLFLDKAPPSHTNSRMSTKTTQAAMSPAATCRAGVYRSTRQGGRFVLEPCALRAPLSC